MAASHDSIVEFTETYVRGMVSRDEQVDCTQPEVFYHLVASIAQAMEKERNAVVTTHDVERAIKSAPTLHAHPLLQRERYFAPRTGTASSSSLSSSSSSSSSFSVSIGPRRAQRQHYDDVDNFESPPSPRRLTPPSSFMNMLRSGWHSLTSAPSASASSQTASFLDGVESQSDSRQQFALEESMRVRIEVRDALLDTLERRSFQKTSNDIDKDWYACVPVQYYTAAGSLVERELELEYSRAEAAEHQHRPFLESFMRYNKTSRGAKQIICTMLFFRFPYDPNLVEASSSAFSSPDDAARPTTTT